jgi:hypothetical protein
MNRVRRLRAGGKVLVALAIGGALFGVARAVQASIPDSNGVIHGCYYTPPGKVNKAGMRTGALRVVDSGKGQQCAPDETALSWNHTGPSGARGPTGTKGTTGSRGPSGAKGTTGPTGAHGPSNIDVAYKGSASSGALTYPNTTTFTAAHLDLPAGTYLVTGKFTPEITNGGVMGNCTLEPTGANGSAAPPASESTANLNTASSVGIPLVLQVWERFGTDSGVDLRCSASTNVDGASFDVRSIHIAAIQTDNLAETIIPSDG